MQLLALGLLWGCSEFRLLDEEGPSDPADASEEDAGDEPVDIEDETDDETTDIDEDVEDERPLDLGDDDDDDDPVEEDPLPVVPVAGDVRINEVMIDPTAVGDTVGEWVEIHNISADWIDLWGLVLADDNIDSAATTEVSYGSLIVEPGGYVVVCTDADFATNGGVSCDATVEYGTFGGAFAMSNSEDEVVLELGGVELDALVYGPDFSLSGAAVGWDDPWWCDQHTRLSGGDRGIPGAANDPC